MGIMEHQNGCGLLQLPQSISYVPVYAYIGMDEKNNTL